MATPSMTPADTDFMELKNEPWFKFLDSFSHSLLFVCRRIINGRLIPIRDKTVISNIAATFKESERLSMVK